MTPALPDTLAVPAILAGRVGIWQWTLATDEIALHAHSAVLFGLAAADSDSICMSSSQFVDLVHEADRDATRRALLLSYDRGEPIDMAIQPAAYGPRVLIRGRRAAHQQPAEMFQGVLIALPGRADDAAIDRLAAIVASSDDAIIGKTLDGLITDWNRGAELIFGYSAAEMIGQPVARLVPSGQEDETNRIIERIKRGERIEHYQTRRRRRDGQVIDVSLTVSPVHDRFGQVIGASKVARDVTRERRTQQRLAELQAELVHMARFSAMGEMASTLAHELNQPLTAVVGYLNGSRRLLSDPDRVDCDLLRDALARASEQALRAGEIIRRLRDFVSRGETQRAFTDLTSLVEEASAMALIGVKETEVRVTRQFDPRAATVLADRIQIQQVILNLIRNAIEAMADMPRRDLVIATGVGRPASEGLAVFEVSVSDSGAGIAPEIADRLFQPFVTSKTNGMGVGLSISRSIAERHGGRLWAEPNPGGGTVFRLTLPACQPGEPDDAAG